MPVAIAAGNYETFFVYKKNQTNQLETLKKINKTNIMCITNLLIT